MSKESIDKIKWMLPDEEILAQLAEEASEVAQAALKLRRAMTGINPTPKSLKDCVASLHSELGDLRNCLTVLGYTEMTVQRKIDAGRVEKLDRWAQRLERNHQR